MKVQCDVCKGGDGAAVFCCADEAALCGPCDARVHSANKLAGKHRRYALRPADSAGQLLPLCDICKENRAFLFCQEDRAILCRDCDTVIHDANDLTRKHTRFLLTGIKLSPCSGAVSYPGSSTDSRPNSVVSSSTATANSAEEASPRAGSSINQSRRNGTARGLLKQQDSATIAGKRTTNKKSKETSPAFDTGFSKVKAAAAPAVDKHPCCSRSANDPAEVPGGGSSISEYLMTELPGWPFEDVLLYPGCLPLGSPVSLIESLTPFRESDVDDVALAGAGKACPVEDGRQLPDLRCVPKTPKLPPPGLPGTPLSYVYDHHSRSQHQQEGLAVMDYYTGGGQEVQLHSWTTDDGFSVPSLVPAPSRATNKRPRASAWRITS